MRQTPLTAYILLSLAQTGISINVVTSKHLLSYIPMLSILTFRFFMSTAFMAVLLKSTKTPICDPRHPKGHMTPSDWGYAILSGFLAGYLFNLLFLWGLNYTTATAAGIVGSTLPAMIALFAVWFLKERLNWPKVMALFLAMLGIFMINIEFFSQSARTTHSYVGDFLIFLAMIPEALYSIINRKLAHRVTPLGAAFIANLVAFLALFPSALITHTLDFSFDATVLGLLVIAATGSGFFFWAWTSALASVPASTAAIFGGVMPVVTTVLAMLFLSERLNWFDFAGIVLVLASIFIGTGVRLRLSKARTSEPA